MHRRDPAVRVYAMVPYPADTTPSQRFRIEQWVPLLSRDGIEVDVAPFADQELMNLLHSPGHLLAKTRGMAAGFGRRAAAAAGLHRYDAIVVHRAACLAGPALVEWMASRRRPVIFDFDDAIYLLHTSPANRLLGWLKFPGKTASLCRLSTVVTAGSEYLAGYARRFNPRVTVVPTSIDTDRYVPRSSAVRPTGPVVVGWTGSATSLSHLEMFAEVLRRLLAVRPVELRVQSNRPPALPGLPFVWRPWSAATEVEEIRQFDIGIKPMPDDPWARGKCPMKELQYMAVGVPAVCSAVGGSLEVIHHGANGFLAATEDEWLQHLVRLVDEPDLRQRVGCEGRRTVEERYSMTVCARRFAGAIREVLRPEPERPQGRG